MKSYYKLLFIIGILFLWNCAATNTTNNSLDESENPTKKSSLSQEDIEECRLYQSYQFDYWKNRNIVVDKCMNSKGFELK